MADTVEAVVGEWESHGPLESDLGEQGQSTESSGHGGRLQVPAEQRGGEVSGGPEIEAAGQGNAGETVGTAANPGDLGLVDRQMGGDGAVQTLLGEVLGGVFRVGGGSNVSAMVSWAAQV